MEESKQEDITVDSRGKNTTHLKIKTRKKFHLGGGKPKYRIDGVVGEKDELKIKLIERNFGNKTDYILKSWEKCKKNNIPVVPFMKVTNKGTVVMPDLSADGSRFYGKGMYYHILGGDGEWKDYFDDMDKNFVALMSNDSEKQKIKSEALKIAKRASSAGIILAKDDPFDLKIDTEGCWKLICLDLEHTLVDSEGKPTKERLSQLMQLNEECPDLLMLSFNNILKTPLFKNNIGETKK